ncbi:MAG TPA: hypothetical protein VFK20_05855 [Vicinamibacterales bacterium]|nr:hypothetical protein [Vicinamibacterales bacterium]
MPPRSDVPGHAGLCRTCRHAAVIVSDRGSVFVRCRRSADDPRFPRYPPLPVVACAGWEPHTGGTDTDPA